ncbi:Cytosolic copper metallochaperone [Coemansia sp. RSA 486]|nr:Cytosolic copper metallochaperone [Coemansia sp. RSA 486]KAJ2235266.1 Cytosolic copper metallochaperone [Coemansia sp. RSA 485]
MTDTVPAPAAVAPATAPAAATNTYEFVVAMSCGGCSGAVTRALAKVEGIESYTVDLATQRVKVITALPRETIFEVIKKTGKDVKDAPAEPAEPAEPEQPKEATA